MVILATALASQQSDAGTKQDIMKPFNTEPLGIDTERMVQPM